MVQSTGTHNPFPHTPACHRVGSYLHGRNVVASVLLLLLTVQGAAAMLFVPMDETQSDHLKAYGLVYRIIKEGRKVYWCLNYRGGSFVTEENEKWLLKARIDGIEVGSITSEQWTQIIRTIENNNMEKVILEKAPRIAVYTPPSKLPWDDAVTLALTYADIPFEKIYDKEVLTGGLSSFDWLHLHHEDFTGQYSKFYASFRHTAWYQRQQTELEQLAAQLGFKKVTECKKAVALAIRNYVEQGGFLFAMCSATNTLDIALAALGTDIVAEPYDGDPIDPQYRQKLNFGNCLAFEKFQIQTNPFAGDFDNIDVNKVNTPMRIPVADFELFDFSAKLDPIPTMLIQNHARIIPGFYGLLTSFNKDVIKKNVVILAQVPGTKMANYIHGVFGKGMFAFLGGHDPEDQTHAVGDKPTLLELHKNSPGYRLILNNVLFPAAQKKEKKT